MWTCIGWFVSVFPYFSFPKLPKSPYKKEFSTLIASLDKRSRTSPASKKNKSEAVNPCSYREIETGIIGSLVEFWGYVTGKAKWF